MSKPKPETTVRMKTRTYERFKRLGKMGESWDDLLCRILIQQPYTNNLKQTLQKANEKNEQAKKDTTRSHLALEALDELITACQKYIDELESR